MESTVCCMHSFPNITETNLENVFSLYMNQNVVVTSTKKRKSAMRLNKSQQGQQQQRQQPRYK